MEENKKRKKLESENLTVVNKRISTSNINELHDVILEIIFSLLPIEEQLRIVSVCKRWNRVIHDHLGVIKSISLNEYTLEQSRRSCLHIKKLPQIGKY